MRSLSHSLFLVLFPAYLLATSEINLSTTPTAFGILDGYVYDKQTNEPISFATIRLVNTTLGDYSNLDGYYSM